MLVRSEMLGRSFKTFTGDHMCSCHNRQKFRKQVPTHLPSKPKTFSGVIIAFLKFTSNSDHFENKITFIPSIYPELLIPEIVVPLKPE